MTRHEFLYALHQLLKPRGYLEIGVQFGTSLRLASCPATGVDPNPQVHGALGPNASIFAETSDDFFAKNRELPPIDLAFIDGMHLAENAFRDFLNIEQVANENTVVVFDDVLPRNQGEAAREQCPGDWTGDVWKVEPILRDQRPDLNLHLVDTEPTGLLVVTNLAPEIRHFSADLASVYGDTVPDDVLTRKNAKQPHEVLNLLKEWAR